MVSTHQRPFTILYWTLLILAGIWPAAIGVYLGIVNHRDTYHVPIPNRLCTAQRTGEGSYLVDLSALKISDADSSDFPDRSNVLVRQDGQLLAGHAIHASIVNNSGLFSHWGSNLYLSPLRVGDRPDDLDGIELEIPYRPWLDTPLQVKEERIDAAGAGSPTIHEFEYLREVIEFDPRELKLPLQHWKGSGWRVDLSSLDLPAQGDDLDAPNRSTLRVFQDGQELKPHALHADIWSKLGLFSHWVNWLYFSPLRAPAEGEMPSGVTVKIEVVRRRDESLQVAAASPLKDRVSYSAFTAAGLDTSALYSPERFFGVRLGQRRLRPARDIIDLPAAPGQYYQERERLLVTPWERSGSAVPETISVELADMLPGPRGGLVRLLSNNSGALLFAVGMLVAAAATFWASFRGDYPWSSFYRLLVIASLAVALSAWILPDWEKWGFTPDSGSYLPSHGACSARNPGYPFFIRIVAGQDLSWEADPRLATVVKAQQLVLVSALLVFASTLAFAFPPPVVTLFCFWLARSGWFTEQVHSVMTETVTQSVLLLLMSVYILFQLHRQGLWLVLAGFLAASAFLIRPAAVFVGPLVLVMFAQALWLNWRRFGPAVVLSAAVGCIVFLPAINFYRCTGRVALTATQSWGNIAYALQVAEPKDIDLMPDELSRSFLASALERKSTFDGGHIDSLFTVSDQLPRNLYQVALPLAQELAGSFDLGFVHDLFARVSSVILRVHAERIQAHFWWAVNYSTTSIGHLSRTPWLFRAMLAATLLLMVLVRGWASVVAAGFVLCHIANVAVTSRYDQPVARYVELTEFMCMTALMILICALLEKLAARWVRQHAHETPFGRRSA